MEDYIRGYLGDYLHIDGRYIWYRLVTAADYLRAKQIIINDEELEDFCENNYKIYELITQIMALKQSCFLLRRVSHSCGSLSDGLYDLKLRLIYELKEQYDFEFDDEFVDNYGHVN
jgi:hypothetical protein